MRPNQSLSGRTTTHDRVVRPSRAPVLVATGGCVTVRPATELSRMTRYRGGTYSHTVDTIVFTDGTSRTHRSNPAEPDLEAYSLDFTGMAPNLPSPLPPGTGRPCPTCAHTARDRGRLDPAHTPSRPCQRRTQPTLARRQATRWNGPIRRTRSHRWQPGRDLASDQRPGAGHPAAERARRGKPWTRTGDHLRVRRPIHSWAATRYGRPPTPPSAWKLQKLLGEWR